MIISIDIHISCRFKKSEKSLEFYIKNKIPGFFKLLIKFLINKTYSEYMFR